MPVKILVQPQEQRNHYFCEWFKSLGYETDEAQIVGDIAVPELGIGIERKTVEDFISSIYDGRLLSQCDEMADTYDHPWLVIDEDPTALVMTKLYSLKPEIYWGTITSVEEHHGCKFAFSFGNLPVWLHYRIKKMQTPGRRIDPVRGHRQSVSVEDRVQHVLMSCPGIGPQKAILAKGMKLIPAIRMLRSKMEKEFRDRVDDDPPAEVP